MGLGLLPWERLPAYLYGPLLSALNVWLLVMGGSTPTWHWLWQLAGIGLGAWAVWYRYKTGREPFATAEADGGVVSAQKGNGE
jgi:hypothetical protein